MYAILLALAQAAPSTPHPAPATPMVSAPYQVGIDTIETIAAKLGKPNSITKLGDGSTIASYVSTKAHVKGASFIPVVGLFAGGAKSHVEVKTFTFSADGRMTNFSDTSSFSNCKVGITGAGCK